MIARDEYPISPESIRNVIEELKSNQTLQDLAEGCDGVSASYISSIQNGRRKLNMKVLNCLSEGLGIAPLKLLEKLFQKEKERIELEKENLFYRGEGIGPQKFYELFGGFLESVSEQVDTSSIERKRNMCAVTLGGYQQPAEVGSWGGKEYGSDFLSSLKKALASGLLVVYIYPDISIGKSSEFGEAAISSAGSISFGLRREMEIWYSKLEDNVFAGKVPENFKLVGIAPDEFPFYGPGNYYLLRNKDHFWGAMSSYEFPRSEPERLPQEHSYGPEYFVGVSEKR